MHKVGDILDIVQVRGAEVVMCFACTSSPDSQQGAVGEGQTILMILRDSSDAAMNAFARIIVYLSLGCEDIGEIY